MHDFVFIYVCWLCFNNTLCFVLCAGPLGVQVDRFSVSLFESVVKLRSD